MVQARDREAGLIYPVHVALGVTKGRMEKYYVKHTAARLYLKVHLDLGTGSNELIWGPDKDQAQASNSISDAAKLWIQRRDSLGFGASHESGGVIVDRYDKPVARVSYNGRLWSIGKHSAPLTELEGA